MVSVRGVTIGVLVIIFGFALLFTAFSPDFLFSLGIVKITTFNIIQKQLRIWGTVLGILIVIIGLVVMGKVD